ncbi:MAG: TauD/TfdA family dioxygenase [Chromatiales bacterium]|nr:TauD/TfdA family dioxygenase [Chromatiales bacterium]
MSFQTEALSPVLGARITGLDLNEPMSKATFNEVRSAWVDASGVLVFGGQSLQPNAQIAFSKRLGELEVHVATRYLLPEHPQIYRVSTKKDADGRAMGNPESGRYWHSDLSYLDPPAMASLLYALEIPPSGGDTMFTNMGAAFEGLSEPLQQMLDGLYAVHDYAHVFRMFSPGFRGQTNVDLLAPVRHPVVRVHAESGRKTLFVNPGFTTHIEGFARHESDALLELLHAHSTRPEFVYRHKWTVGDAVLWDNRCTMHHAVHDFYGTGGVRHMHRTTIMGAPGN